ncbi:hypothetical protein GCK32_004664 [Trichostrongylus colubriformis]|uniref:ELM2 domain-containing protein n=1 Tax=Trichostrongylus colubriformis TaxID=6319 RepID=A0AAN8EQJ7_TRICO
MYADDFKIYSSIVSPEDSVALQRASDRVAVWCTDWELPLAAEKTAVNRIGSGLNSEFSGYCIDNTRLKYFNEVKDLAPQFMGERFARISSNVADVPEIIDEEKPSLGNRLREEEEDDRDVMVWNPSCRLSEKQIDEYLKEAERKNVPIDKAHDVLSFFNYDIKKSLEFCSEFVVPDLYSDAEKLVICNTMKLERFRSLKTRHKFFPLKRLLPHQSHASITEYYYKNKRRNFTFIPRPRSVLTKVEVSVDENVPRCHIMSNQFLVRKRKSLTGRRRKSTPKLSQRKTERRSP